MGELFEQICREGSLLAAWNAIRLSATRRGTPSDPMLQADGRVATRISEIADSLAAATWRPAPVHPIVLPRSGDKQRTLGVPPIVDRIVERSLLDGLEPIADPEFFPWSFGYRRRLGVPDALRSLCDERDDGGTWVARADVADCFDSIPRRALLERLRDLVPDGRVLEIVRLLLYRPVRGDYRRSGKGLHQGSVLSPLLANVYLHEFDRLMVAAGVRAIRYADDVAVVASSQSEAADALHLVFSSLRRIGLASSPSKSRCISFDTGVPFLGETVGARTAPEPGQQPKANAVALYVTTPGSLLRRKGKRLVVEQPGGDRQSIGLGRLRQVVLYGRVGLTTPAVHELLRSGIDVAFLSEHGQYRGRLAGVTSPNPILRRAQYESAGDDGVRLEIARRIVAGKIANMRVYGLRLARQHAQLRSVGEVAARLARHRRSASRCGTIGALLGVEGSATREHFTVLREMVAPRFDFPSRKRRPPPDPVNSMLSFGYSLLAQEAIAAVEAAGMDPYMGFLHTPRQGVPGLALDLMEEFRPVIVDTVVTQLARKTLTSDDFTIAGENGCRLRDAARRTFLGAYERRMRTLVLHPDGHRRVPYRVALGMQAKSLAEEISGRDGSYRPMLWK